MIEISFLVGKKRMFLKEQGVKSPCKGNAIFEVESSCHAIYTCWHTRFWSLKSRPFHPFHVAFTESWTKIQRFSCVVSCQIVVSGCFWGWWRWCRRCLSRFQEKKKPQEREFTRSYSFSHWKMAIPTKYTLSPIIMVQWKMAIFEKVAILLEIHPFLTSMIMGGNVSSRKVVRKFHQSWMYWRCYPDQKFDSQIPKMTAYGECWRYIVQTHHFWYPFVNFRGVFFSNCLGSKSICKAPCRLKIYHWHSGSVDMPCMSLLNDI